MPPQQGRNFPPYPPYPTYVLRLRCAERDGEPASYFILEDVRSGERRAFASPEELCTFLKDIVALPAGESQPAGN